MKKLLLFLVLIVSAINIQAQDVIVKKDGTTIISKILEIGTSEIKYKNFSNLEGPIYGISRSDVMRIIR